MPAYSKQNDLMKRIVSKRNDFFPASELEKKAESPLLSVDEIKQQRSFVEPTVSVLDLITDHVTSDQAQKKKIRNLKRNLKDANTTISNDRVEHSTQILMYKAGLFCSSVLNGVLAYYVYHYKTNVDTCSA